MSYQHQPVLLNEILEYLNPQSGQMFIDCTLGGAGHTAEILRRVVPAGKVLGIDLDPVAIAAATKKVKSLGLEKNFETANNNFGEIKKEANLHKFNKVNGILLDLGLSSDQLQDKNRGFSFLSQGSLDMRFGPSQELTAEKIVNEWSKDDLKRIFTEFGEEKLSGQISQKIIEVRQEEKISTPEQLVSIISDIYKKRYHGKSKTNPATKVFQALRIVVNTELDNLAKALPDAVELLVSGGRLAVISYHSLEDRIVKNFFREQNKECICPPDLPVCRCDHKKTVDIITKKIVLPTEQEVMENPRSRSAKLRVVQKI